VHSVHRKVPGKKRGLAIGSLDQWRRRARLNPAALAAGSAEAEVGEVCGLTSDRIVAEFRAEKRPATVLGGARRTAAAALLLRRGGGST
jgi:hypothetical protein